MPMRRTLTPGPNPTQPRPLGRCRSRDARSCDPGPKELMVTYAAVIEVDNTGEDPDEGRRGLREELLPVLKAMPGFVSAALLTAYDQGRGLAVVSFDTAEDA